VQWGPSTLDRDFYESTPQRVADAIEGRITKKHRPMDMSTHERDKVSDITKAFIEEMKGPKGDSAALHNIAQWTLYGNLKSKKWSLNRAEVALNFLVMRLMPEYEFTAAIKLEPMQPGKPPRMLIADGDQGAVMSCLAIGVLERYVCKYHKTRTIKGKAKDVRMGEICNATKVAEHDHNGNPTGLMKGFMLENDGSAWDTCCSVGLRDLSENMILDHMFEEMYRYFVPWNMHTGARKTADTKKKHNLHINSNKVKLEDMKHADKGTPDDNARAAFKKRFKVTIEAIRRSGDRGTSILNWLVNLICWAWVLCDTDGAHFVISNSKKITDMFGVKRHFRPWFEGDDSAIWLSGRRFTKDEMHVLFSRWEKLGHNPKLFDRGKGDVAEFCGWKIVMDEFGMDWNTATPDVPRLLGNCFYSTAKEAVSSANEGHPLVFGRVVGPGLIARAASIAKRMPSIASWLLVMAASVGDADGMGDVDFSVDDQFRMGIEVYTDIIPEWWKDDDPETILDVKYGSFVDQTYRAVSDAVATGAVEREVTLALRHGWVKDSSEWFDFITALQCVSVMTSDEEYRKIVPAGMM